MFLRARGIGTTLYIKKLVTIQRKNSAPESRYPLQNEIRQRAFEKQGQRLSGRDLVFAARRQVAAHPAKDVGTLLRAKAAGDFLNALLLRLL